MPGKPSPRLDRQGRAYLLLARCGAWADVRLANGTKAFAIPSESVPGKWHISNGRACTCESFQKVVELSGTARACKHGIAVHLYNQTVREMILDIDADLPPYAERALLGQTVFRAVAQEILAGTLTPRQLGNPRYADILGEI